MWIQSRTPPSVARGGDGVVEVAGARRVDREGRQIRSGPGARRPAPRAAAADSARLLLDRVGEAAAASRARAAAPRSRRPRARGRRAPRPPGPCRARTRPAPCCPGATWSPPPRATRPPRSKRGSPTRNRPRLETSTTCCAHALGACVLAAISRQLAPSAWSALRRPSSGFVVGSSRAVTSGVIPTVDRVAVAGQVLADGQVERAAVVELDHLLEGALAERRLADDRREAGVGQRGGRRSPRPRRCRR